MKKTNTNKILILLSNLAVIIGIFCMFAAAFNEDGGSVRGSVFQVMAPLSETGYHLVVPLVIGLTILLLSVVLGFLSLVLDNKKLKFAAGVLIVLDLAGAVLFFLTPTFYMAANPEIGNLDLTGATSLGAGPICVGVFTILGALLSLISIVLKGTEATSQPVKGGIRRAR